MGVGNVRERAGAEAGELFFSLSAQYTATWVSYVMAILLMTSFIATAVALQNASSRYMFALGREGLLPRWLGQRHPKHGSPARANLVQTVVTSVVIALAATATDGEGHFTIGATLPTDLASGTYAIEVNGASGVRMTDWVQVDGAPIYGGQGGGPVGRDEGLPTLPPNLRQAAPGTVTASGNAGDPAAEMDLVPLFALLAAVGGFALFVRWTRRPPGRRAESADLP